MTYLITFWLGCLAGAAAMAVWIVIANRDGL